MRSVRVVLPLALVIAGYYFTGYWRVHEVRSAVRVAPKVLAIVDVKVYPSPDAAAIEHATVVVRDGRIAAVGAGVKVPPGARVITCTGCVVTAGFWNAHVHLTEAKWNAAATEDSATLNPKLRDLAAQRGFTTIVDLGSDIRVTGALRRRIAAGEVAGPMIYTAGSGIFPPNGIPYYLNNLPPAVLAGLPQPATAEAARAVVEANIAAGSDLVKLFTGSIVKRGTVLPMPEPIAQAAVQAGRAHHQLAFAHTSDLAGTTVARDAGVDVLAHAPSFPTGVDSAFLKTVVDHHMWMIPTLKMYATTVTTAPAFLDPIYQEVRWFHELGGRFVFGTDVGFMTDYSTNDELRALAACGLNGKDILRMLTTAPAELFGVASERGTVEVGKAGDLVVLRGDPMNRAEGFADVLVTVRDGRVLYDGRAGGSN